MNEIRETCDLPPTACDSSSKMRRMSRFDSRKGTVTVQ